MAEVKWGDVTADTPIDHLTPQSHQPNPTATVAPAPPPPLVSFSLPSSSASSAALSSADAAPQALGEAAQTPPPPLASSAAPFLPSPLPSLSAPPPPPPSSSIPDAAVASLTASLSSSLPPLSGVVESKDEEDALPLRMHSSGLHPHDADAQVVVKGASDGSAPLLGIYQAAETFEQLGLSRELQAAVVELRFTKPSKIQAQALPIILSPQHPNLIGQAHHGSGKVNAQHLTTLGA